MDPQIRIIFVEELEDVLDSMSAALGLAQAAAAEERERAALELRRGFHTLKGAAHAVGDTVVQIACERAETAIAARSNDIDAVSAIARAALPQLHRRLEELRRETGAAPDAPPPSRAPESTAEPPASERAVERAREAGTVRVSTDRIDAILTAAEEMSGGIAEARATRALEAVQRALEGARASVEALARETEGVTGRSPGTSRARRAGAAHLSPARAALRALGEASAQVDRGIGEVRWSADAMARGSAALASELRALRVGSLATLVPVLQAAVAEACETLGRESRLEVRGAEVEIDRKVRDELREPLLHLVRNAVDHGIEPPAERARAGKSPVGRIEVHSSIVGGEVCIAVSDDGRGVDQSALRARARALGMAEHESSVDPLALLFEAGLSTRDESGPVSGRGLGLDVVRDRVARMHGRIEVETQPGVGTRFVVRLPLAHGALQVVHARCRGIHVVIPASAVESVRRVRSEAMVTIEGRLHVPAEPGPLPLARLDAALGVSGGMTAPASALSWIVVRALGRRVALGVDAILDAREMLVHSLGGGIRRLAGVSGTTLLPDGQVALLLDVDAVVRAATPARAEEASPERGRAKRLLVVDDSITTRALQRMLLEAAGFHVAVAAHGREALEHLAEADVDAVIADIEMPVMDGLELLEWIRAAPRTRSLPVVLVTARDRESDRRRALELGANAYVLKQEFDREQLLAIIEDLV